MSDTLERLRERITANVGHIARGCRAGTSHNPAVYEQAIEADVRALLDIAEAAREVLDYESRPRAAALTNLRSALAALDSTGGAGSVTAPDHEQADRIAWKVTRYEHGGARFYTEDESGRKLQADTYNAEATEFLLSALDSTGGEKP